MIRLTTLGGYGISVEGPEGRRTLPAQGKRGAFLAYLAVERPLGESHSRDTLMAMFWPQSDDRRARDALKQLTRSVRRDLGPQTLLTTHGNGIAINPAELTCDAAELVEAAAAEDHHRVLQLYGGDFLAGFHLAGSAGFDQWLTRQHLRFVEVAVTAARSLTEFHEADDDIHAALAMARRVVELRPFDEGGLRTLVRLYLDAGEPGQAVAAYEGYARRLSDELNANPSAETVALVERAKTRVINRDSPDPAVTDTVSAGPLPPGPRPPRQRRWRAATAAGVGLIAAAVAVQQLRSPTRPTLDETRILVDLFENRTGDSALDSIGPMASDHVTSGLNRFTFGDVITRAGAMRSATDADATAAAVRAGAGTLVTGSYEADSGDRLRLDARVFDVEAGHVVADIETVVASLEDIGVGLESLVERLIPAVAPRADPRVEAWLPPNASRPADLEVYQTFVEALEAHTRQSRFAFARGLFWEAYQADTTFTMAALWAGLAAENRADRRFADSLYAALTMRRRALPPVDAYFLDYLKAPNAAVQLEALRQLLRFAPESSYRGLAAGAAFRNQMPEEALAHSAVVGKHTLGQGGGGNIEARSLEVLGRCQDVLDLVDRSAEWVSPYRFDRLELHGMRMWGNGCAGDVDGFLESAETFVREAFGAGHLREPPIGFRESRRLGMATQVLIRHSSDPSAYVPAVEYVTGVITQAPVDDPFAPAVLAELLASAGREDAARQILDRA